MRWGENEMRWYCIIVVILFFLSCERRGKYVGHLAIDIERDRISLVSHGETAVIISLGENQVLDSIVDRENVKILGDDYSSVSPF